MKKQVLRPFLAIGAFLLCANFGSQDSSISGREKPKINFYGTLTDTSGNTFEVKNITASGLYKQIPMYVKPKNPKNDPGDNITRLDLHEIAEIEVPHPDTFLTFNGRQYVEVIVTSSDKEQTQNTYIIEKSKRIICDQKNTAGAIEKDLSFKAINKIIIKGHETPSPKADDAHPKGHINKPQPAATPTPLKSVPETDVATAA